MKVTITDFIRHCIKDNEFWVHGGIPTRERQYIKALGLNEEQTNRFYVAMIELQKLNREVGEREVQK